jgi:hypothetical protein
MVIYILAFVYITQHKPIILDPKTDVLIEKSKHQFHGHLYLGVCVHYTTHKFHVDHENDVLILKSKHQIHGHLF